MSYKNFFGYNHFPDPYRILLTKYVSFQLLDILFYNISSTFLYLLVIDRTGIIFFSFVYSLGLLVQSFLDYPSGSLGDTIGYNKVLFIGYLLIGLFYFFLSFTESNIIIAILFIIKSIGDSQISGAIESWFDSSYLDLDKSFDRDRTNYSFFQSRLLTSQQAISVPIFIIGGLFASLFNRGIVIFFQGIGNCFIAFGCLIFLKRIKSQSSDFDILTESTKSSYLVILFNGLKFIFTSSKIFIFILGLILIGSLQIIWMRLIILFIYIGYTGNDATAGTFRSIIYCITVFMYYFNANFSKKIRNPKIIGYVLFGWGIFFFGAYSILTYFFPLINAFEILPILIIIFLIMPLGSLCGGLYFLLKQRMLSKLVPNEIRNSVYSLIPTIQNIFLVPLLILFSFGIEFYSFSFAIMLISIIIIFIGFVFIFIL